MSAPSIQNNPTIPALPEIEGQCSKRELQAACDRWTGKARALLEEIRNARPPFGMRKFLLARLGKIHARLKPAAPFGIFNYLLAVTFERMISNLMEGTPKGTARRLFYCACEVVDQANESNREPMRDFLPVACDIRDQARELMQ